jgi:hypothetical protein
LKNVLKFVAYTKVSHAAEKAADSFWQISALVLLQFFVVEVDAVTSLNLSLSRMAIILETDNSSSYAVFFWC